jgi:hypothetical protein
MPFKSLFAIRIQFFYGPFEKLIFNKTIFYSLVFMSIYITHKPELLQFILSLGPKHQQQKTPFPMTPS